MEYEREQRVLENLERLVKANPSMREMVRRQTARLLPTDDERDATAAPLKPRQSYWSKSF